jgi:hypothetical protein
MYHKKGLCTGDEFRENDLHDTRLNLDKTVFSFYAIGSYIGGRTLKKFAAKIAMPAMTLIAGCNVTLSGQMPVTANANFDTKIGEQPAATQSVAVKPMPEATPSKKAGTLIIAPDYATVNGDSVLAFQTRKPLWSGHFTAQGATITITELPFEVIGTAPKDDKLLVDMRLVNPNGFISLSRLTNGFASYVNPLGLETIKESDTINLQFWPKTNVSDEIINGIRPFFELYNGTTIGVSLNPTKVKTLNNDKIEAHQSLSFEPKPFCCYSR